MKNWFKSAVICAVLVTPCFGNGKGPEVDLVDNKLSIDAQAIPLGRLLRLLDSATGMKSKVPPELANRNISVTFSGLSFNDGVRKIFQGQPLDYILIQGQGIVVTAQSQTLGASESVPPYNNPTPQPEQPFVQNFQDQFQPPVAGAPGQQPATIQTPFGPVANPRAPQPPPQPNAPLSVPGQQNSLFPSSPGQQNNQGQPVINAAPGQNGVQTPFGTVNPFGTQAQPQNNNAPSTLFGNPFSTPGTQQRNP